MTTTLERETPTVQPVPEAAPQEIARTVFGVITPILLAFNVIMPVWFCWGRWSPHQFDRYYLAEKLLLAGYLALMGAAGVCQVLWSRARLAVFRIALIAFMAVGMLGLFEVAGSLWPSAIPKVLIDFEPQLNPGLKQTRQTLLHHLPESPWVTFKPNIRVRSIGDRGPDFAYEWTTDQFGFKNPPEIAGLGDVVALAIGDSFVEASGVPTDQTWCAVLSRRGFPTYNLGVQGYGPQQMVGSLRLEAARRHADWILFGYTPGFEDRAVRVLHPEQLAGDSQAMKAIEPISNYMREKRANETRSFRVLNALLDFTKSQARYAARTAHDRCPGAAPGSPLARYCAEVRAGEHIVFDPSREAWRLTSDEILAAQREASARGARFAVVLFSSRSAVYDERLMGRPLPASHYERQAAEALASWCRAHGIPLVTTWPVFAGYMASLPSAPRQEQLPYFSVDGHMNAVGQRLVADAVIRTLDIKEVSRDE